MKKLVCLLAAFATFGFSYGQNWKYKTEGYLKQNRLHEADSTVQKYLSESLNDPKSKPAKIAELYKLGAEINFQIAQPELLKGAESLPLDTATFIKATERALEYCALSNKYDYIPAKEGADPKPQFVERNKEIVNKMLDFYYFTAFFYVETDKPKSAAYFLKYTQSYKHPVFTQDEQDSIFASKKENYAKAAGNAAWIFYELKDWDNLIPAAQVATQDSSNQHNAYLMMCEAHLAKGDTAQWVNTLQQAIENDPKNDQFIEWLQVYYVGKNDIQSAEEIADRLIASQPGNPTGYYMKGCVELNMKKNYTGSRELFEKVLAINPEHAGAHVNIGTAYINEITDKVNSGVYKYVGTSKLVPQKDKAIYERELNECKGFYEKALPHYEKARELLPDNKRAWAYPLYVIYTNLKDESKAAEMKVLLDN